MRRLAPLLAGAVLLPLAGCNFAPPYHRPAMQVPASYQDAQPVASGAWKVATPDDAAPRGEWWRLFDDDELNALEARVESANQDIAAAVARYDEARAAVSAAQAQLFPTINANASGEREQNSKTVPNVYPKNLYNEYTYNADFSYELDLWGRVRNAVAQARALASASKADLATMDLDSHAELATDFFALRGDDTAISVLTQTVSADQKALTVVQNRFNNGDAAEGDLDQSQAQLADAQTQEADERSQRAAMEHAIAILVGASAAQFTIPPAPLKPADPGAIPVPAIDPGIPSELLERRPDVAAAERRVIAANANIGIARAAYFPTISLNALFGGQSASLGDLFAAPSRIWSFGPSISQPLFEGGALDAATATARAERAEAIADYRNTVLGAFRDVEDNLVTLQELQQENATAAIAAKDEQKAYNQAQNLYQGGVDTYLDVLVPQTNELQAQLTLANVEARRLETSVLLIKAVGGGWKG